MNKRLLIQELKHYESPCQEERLFVPRFLSLLVNFQNCFSRSLSTGHLTASAFIVNPSGQLSLLTHHKKLNRWLQPGGHADGNEDVFEVAWKEATEETGLETLEPISREIFDIDIHLIPAMKNNAAHFHYDIRYLFSADPDERLQISDESHDLAWIAINQIDRFVDGNKSIERMCKKLKDRTLI